MARSLKISGRQFGIDGLKGCGLNLRGLGNFAGFMTGKSLPWLMGAIALCLSGCSSARLVSFPYDPSGRGLNSQFAEQQPAIAGRYTVFTSDRQNRQDIYLYDKVARGLVELPGLNALDMIESHPTISEDGRYLVFAGARDGKTGIYLYNRDTRQLRNLTENLKAQVRNPTISADGRAIAFETSSNGQWDIVVYNRLGQMIEN
jgi:Tol biopolymer transport system component